MNRVLRTSIVVGLGFLTFFNRTAKAVYDAQPEQHAGVHVEFANGDAAVLTLSNGVLLFSNENDFSDQLPSDLVGLQFTRHAMGGASAVTLDIAPGNTVYIFAGNGPRAAGMRNALTAAGWSRIQDLQFKGDVDGSLYVYKQTFGAPAHVNLPADKGPIGAIIAARQITLVTPTPAPDSPSVTSPHTNKPSAPAPSDVQFQITDSDAPAARFAKTQSSIKALYVHEQDDGDALGIASDLILTVTPGSPKHDAIPVRFSTPVGQQMNRVLEDVVRAINTQYPRIEAKRIEFSFQDKYENYDGGSIGAALGTLMLASLKEIDIDPQFAITGDVSAEGKIRVIGGVGAKLRGAKDAGCTIAAIPDEDFEQLVDAVIFNGVSEITDVQVIGISTLDDAIAIARADRDPKETDAINLFGEIQQSMQASSSYLHGDVARDKLKHITELAPNHLSARLLLQIAQNKQRKRLTAGASAYYAMAELKSVIPVPTDKDEATGAQHLTPEAVNDALRALKKLRPISDLRIQPFVDSCSELIQARSNFDAGMGSHEMVIEKYRFYSDQFDKLRTDHALMEKMQHEGI